MLSAGKEITHLVLIPSSASVLATHDSPVHDAVPDTLALLSCRLTLPSNLQIVLAEVLLLRSCATPKPAVEPRGPRNLEFGSWRIRLVADCDARLAFAPLGLGDTRKCRWYVTAATTPRLLCYRIYPRLVNA